MQYKLQKASVVNGFKVVTLRKTITQINLKREDIEIMAPVGSYESLAAALNAGANSVYFGIEKLNMRSHSANNFDEDDLRKIVGICSERNVKTYLTVNTIIYNNDLDLMRSIIDTAKGCGVSAVIACDVAVLSYARSKGVEVHLSTQLNISNIEAIRFYSQFADVVVLAREVTLDQVAEIHKQIEDEHICGPSGRLIRIEMFCHGALCMAISGKCYLSLHNYAASANRGSCYQLCRRSYILKDKETEEEIEVDNQYLMSPKDLKTIHFLNKLLDAGVRVLKIEGRARGPEYVKTVVECYSEAVDSYLSDTFTEQKIEEWNNRLSQVFNRGFWNGYYLGQRLGEWSSTYGSSATTQKVYRAKVRKFFSRLFVAELRIETKVPLKKGDHAIVIGPTTGVVDVDIEEIHTDDGILEEAGQGMIVSIKVPVKVRENDKLYVIEEK